MGTVSQLSSIERLQNIATVLDNANEGETAGELREIIDELAGHDPRESRQKLIRAIIWTEIQRTEEDGGHNDALRDILVLLDSVPDREAGESPQPNSTAEDIRTQIQALLDDENLDSETFRDRLATL